MPYRDQYEHRSDAPRPYTWRAALAKLARFAFLIHS